MISINSFKRENILSDMTAIQIEVTFLGRARIRAKVIRFQIDRGKITIADQGNVNAFLCTYRFPVF